MSDREGRAEEGAPEPVESPCIDVCAIDEESGLCEGCGRTIDEIVEWGTYSPERRREIIGALAARQRKGSE